MANLSYLYEEVFDLDEALTMPTLSSSSNIASRVIDVEQEMLSFPVIVTQNDHVCSVCTEYFEPPHNGGRQIRCGHVYHAQCIATWLSICNTCPLCRVVVLDHKTI
ncbi:hypothetical protein RND81_06G162900 [Saponaria officinalis]|uniref:RING-type E3 ubiquitin transferase n=1 Tax=Saponaria officinalis TaxID=3572 RepID=A0AAW1KCD2_SAPOF